MNISLATTKLGLNEAEIRALCEKYSLPINTDENGLQYIEDISVVLLASKLEGISKKLDAYDDVLRSASTRTQPETLVTTSAEKSARSKVTWADSLAAFSALAAAFAAGGAVWLASTEISRAVSAFKVGNQYQFQNDFVTAFEQLQREHPAALVVSTNERFRLGRQIEDGEGFPDGFWDSYTLKACAQLIAIPCAAEPIIRKNLFEGYDGILESCFLEYAESENICRPKGG